MKYIEEYRDRDLIMKLSEQIKVNASGKYIFMEVCGGHTSAIRRFGIQSLLPADIKLVSGPGCPVCVTDTEYIDRVVLYSRMPDVIIASFGDLLRVPGSISSLEKERSAGNDIRIVFSALDALNIAGSNPEKKVIFPGIGFETTAPGSAVAVKKARDEGINNFLMLSAHKIMPPAMEAVVRDGVSINGFICPGHVAAITGSRIFDFLPERYNIGCVVSGFEPSDLLQAILMLIKQVNSSQHEVQTGYTRVVTTEGNLIAQRYMNEVFEKCNVAWRGFGVIPGSGLCLRSEFIAYDADKQMPLEVESHSENPACLCGDILRGKKDPEECSLFRKVCSPDFPVGACMVSPEGACNSYFRYTEHE